MTEGCPTCAALQQELRACAHILVTTYGINGIPNRLTDVADHLAALQVQVRQLDLLLGRYLDNHCANADCEGMSTLCECKLCLDTRAALLPREPAPDK